MVSDPAVNEVLSRLIAAVRLMPETADRIDKADVIRLIRAEQTTIYVPPQRGDDHHPSVTHVANGSWQAPGDKEKDHG